MQDETMGAPTGQQQNPNDPGADAPLPGDPDGASINDTPMSDPDETKVTDEDIDMFENDPNIPTE